MQLKIIFYTKEKKYNQNLIKNKIELNLNIFIKWNSIIFLNNIIQMLV